MNLNFIHTFFYKRKRGKSIILFVCLLFSGIVSAQNKQVNFSSGTHTIQRIFQEIEKQTGLFVDYNHTRFDVSRQIVLEPEDRTLSSVMNKVLKDTQFQYTIERGHVIIKEKEPVPAEQRSGSPQIQVTGVILDDMGEPVIGANIVEKGTTNGSMSDLDGRFSILVPGNAVLQVSYIGFLTKEEPVRNREMIRIELLEDTKTLEEVVVVGYGTQKRGNLTGAISSIKSEEILTTTHSSLAQSLQGKIPGLQIRQQSGEPGNYDSNISIRGFGTPLYVIDGIVRDGSSEFNKLNPNDIETISILKDASAAIYGLNAGNGVILVTTKKGVNSKPKFSYNGVVGWQKPTDVPTMASAAQYMEMVNDANINSGGEPYLSKEELAKWQQKAPGYEGTDWYGETMKNSSMQQQHDLSIRGGSDNVNYFLSFGYLNEEGLLKSNQLHYNKYTLRSNVTAKLSEYLTADVMISGRYDKHDYPGENFFWIFRGTRVSLPTESPYINNDPRYPARSTMSANSVAMSHKENSGYGENKNKSFQSSATLTYQVPFVKGLNLKGTIAYDSNNYLEKKLTKSYKVYSYSEVDNSYTSEITNSPSNIQNKNQDNNRLVFQAQATYSRTFAPGHNVGGTLVFEHNKGWYRESWLKREYDFYTNDQINQAGLNNQETSGFESENASLSYVGRFNYDYKGKYLIEYAFRYDGSYRYAPGQRWGFFPVVSGGWRISEENFFKKNISFVDNLKIRASFGEVGENAGDPFQYVPGFSTSGGGGYEFVNGSWTTGASSPAIVNQNLTWFKSKIVDVGLDISLFNYKLNIEFDLYQRDRKGLLSKRNLSLPNTFGGTLPEENLNTDRVRGLDFAVNHTNKIGDFQYGIGVNLNFARTMKRYVERADYRSSYDRWRNGNTYRWEDINWGYQTTGQFQSMEELIHAAIQNGDLGNTRELPGDFRFYDANGDGIIDGKDEMPLFWGGNPKMHYGITLSAAWKNFDLNALFQGSGKYTVRFEEVYSMILWSKGNTPAYFYDRWHLADPYDPNSEWIAGKWPATRFAEHMGSLYRESNVWRKNASYFRMKSLELGYTLPTTYTRKYWMDNVRIYVNAYNLFTIADSFVKPFDPEMIEGSFKAGLGYPLTRSYNIGINVTF